jgi:hypothetical protein
MSNHATCVSSQSPHPLPRFRRNRHAIPAVPHADRSAVRSSENPQHIRVVNHANSLQRSLKNMPERMSRKRVIHDAPESCDFCAMHVATLNSPPSAIPRDPEHSRASRELALPRKLPQPCQQGARSIPSARSSGGDPSSEFCIEAW